MRRLPVAIAAYLAGLVDGEGCIEIAKRSTDHRRRTPSYFARVRVGMSHEATVRFIAKWLPGNIYVHKPGGAGSSYKPHYCWTATSRDAEASLVVLRPYLRTKRPEAEIVMRFLRFINARNHRTRVIGHFIQPHTGGRLPRRVNSKDYMDNCERMYVVCRSFKSGKGRRQDALGKVA